MSGAGVRGLTVGERLQGASKAARFSGFRGVYARPLAVRVLVLAGRAVRVVEILAMSAVLVLMLVRVVAAMPVPVLMRVAMGMTVRVRVLVRMLGAVGVRVLVHVRVDVLVLVIMGLIFAVRVRVAVGAWLVLGCAAAILTHRASFAVPSEILLYLE